jgi:anti-anti-sigma factor
MTVPPFLNLASATNPRVSTIAVHCELVRGTEDLVIAELMPRVKKESIELDLSGVERIDAAGIAALITLYCTATEAGNQFHIVDPSVRVLELLRLVGLESILLPQEQPAENTDKHLNPNQLGQLAKSAA